MDFFGSRQVCWRLPTESFVIALARFVVPSNVLMKTPKVHRN